MGRPRYMDAYCGHTSTEEYLDNPGNFLGCCAKCWKKMDKEASKKKLEDIRVHLTVWCEDCKKNVRPLERAGVALSVFWNRLSEEKAKKLTLTAHYRHQHTDYDDVRTRLGLEGWDSSEARNIARGHDPD